MTTQTNPATDLPVYGNYRDYYYKRPLASDARLALLSAYSPDLFSGKRVLDVGCNEGWITCEIAQSLGASKVVGVDVDSALIERAWHRRRTCFSRQRTSVTTKCTPEQEETLRIRRIDATYFPASCEHMFGPLPTPRSTASTAHEFPHNISFRVADWTRERIPEDGDGYDVVVAFSVSKWIHLNTGDDGLLTFFRKVHSTLQPGGMLILEPQDRSSYQKAGRMHEKLRSMLHTLELRPEDFPRILTEIGFKPVEHLTIGTSFILNGGFDRPLDLYIKI
ncbi:Bin3-domain-containing protein [Punctularia strigosozonata HHB-11173 SS5]|uniref:Bin3-domain-containing protein n=1 Tax=Punctularia strigosozonata (strain HHB-11173) TaxID=741275 RepID=UPI000441660A|nr:Bin3-domain-containing protein [Punctularia strigosozonata HHB-11173 SS5]EIN08979.1 Bin3-domain-containing protein [Punctularia strigosozonata HHB-11173 SS5]